MTLTTTLLWLLCFAMIYLIFTSFILIRNRFELTPILNENSDDLNNSKVKISVCIPARNEEVNIGRLLDSIVTQKYNHFDVHVLDDQSEDRTFEIVQAYHDQYPDLIHLHRGEKKPSDWMGKPWACQQLGNYAKGQILLFLDADTTLEPNLISSVSAAFRNYDIQMLTVWPEQILGTFWEKCVIPLVYYALVTILPSIYVYRNPRWMPNWAALKLRNSFAAACGQCIAIKNKTYIAMGGHGSVKNRIVEDVELARVLKSNGFNMRMFHGVNSISCRMYLNEKEMFNGFRKNFFTGFNHSLILFIIAAVIHLIVFILPYLTLFYSLTTGYGALFYLSIGSIGLVLLHRLILALWFKWDPIYAFTHPLGVLWFQRLGLVSLMDLILGKKKEWKGRTL